MATVNYLYRSTREKAPLNLRLLYAHNSKNNVIGGKTQLIVTREYWETEHHKKRINDIDRANYQKEVKTHLIDLETHILKRFQKVNPDKVNKSWLKKTIETFYNPESKKQVAPDNLIKFFEFYKKMKENDLSKRRLQRVDVVKEKIKRFEEKTKQTIFIHDVNDVFKKAFVDYCIAEGYALNTIQSEIALIKTVCLYAHKWQIKTSPQLDDFKIKGEKNRNVYLTPEELQRIINLDLPKDGYLDNARDWLIISCYTGQRISDFLRFTPEMVRTEKGKKFLEFTQMKTKKLIVIPFLKEAYTIFEKNGGNFPRQISSQKYNRYIKEVCEKAEITDLVKGKKITFIGENEDNAGRNDYRKLEGLYPKHELVSSHIGRRSFATNFYGKVPTSYLIQITGHSTEKMFLKYIQKTEADSAFDAFKYFE